MQAWGSLARLTETLPPVMLAAGIASPGQLHASARLQNSKQRFTSVNESDVPLYSY